ncbi:hypothetical protein EFJ49_23100 [Escherichia coli]|nr:hypothetical protein [Escherichia coli]
MLKVGRLEPSRKRCRSRGEINADLTLAIRTWASPNCGSGHHSGIYAASNIRVGTLKSA